MQKNDNRGAKHFKYQVKTPNIFWKIETVLRTKPIGEDLYEV